jgi:hypothetical protein
MEGQGSALNVLAMAALLLVPIIGTVLVERAARRSGATLPAWLRVFLVAAVLFLLAERLVYLGLSLLL